MSTLVLITVLIAALYAAAAYALRPPAFVEWPGYRSCSQDLSKLRVSLAGMLRSRAEDALGEERAKRRKLEQRITRLDARIVTVTAERDEARTEAWAVRRMSFEDALAIVAAGRDAVAESDEGAEGAAAAAALRPHGR